jgi:hypothetical protein
VLTTRREIIACDVELNNACLRVDELEAARQRRVDAARAAVRRFVEIANALPPLIHSEVAGIAGREGTLAHDEEQQAAGQA